MKSKKNNTKTPSKNKELIETGVDKLVELIKKKKKITIKEAAKEISVSEDVIKEWAEFLEEEGIIEIKYNLVSSYLVAKELSEREIQQKKKQLNDDKQIFSREGDSLLNQIENDSKDIEMIKEEFQKLKEEIELDSDEMKEKLNELDKFNDSKRHLQSLLNQEKQKYEQEKEESHKKLMLELKRYNELIKELENEKNIILKEKETEKKVEQSGEDIKNKINLFENTLEKLKEEAKKHKIVVESNESIIDKISDKIKQLKSEIEDGEKKIVELEGQHQEKEDKLIELEKKFFEKYKKTKESDINVNELKDRYSRFLNKKSEIELKLDKIETEKEKLEKSLRILITKAAMVNGLQKNNESKQSIEDLKKKFEEIAEKKKKFEEEIRNILYNEKI
ncbi:MAG: hypothetical protein GWP09_00075 [Nitrospiraceae bacterium]|nr:hypothetical protein [Nitrospiraceae bacterium]